MVFMPDRICAAFGGITPLSSKELAASLPGLFGKQNNKLEARFVLHTDGLAAYRGAPGIIDRCVAHDWVNHSQKEW